MRKQVEALRGTLVFTAQERPEGLGKGFREDIFKKWASGDGIFGRMPYAVVTRVVTLLGWKRTVGMHNAPDVVSCFAFYTLISRSLSQGVVSIIDGRES